MGGRTCYRALSVAILFLGGLGTGTAAAQQRPPRCAPPRLDRCSFFRTGRSVQANVPSAFPPWFDAGGGWSTAGSHPDGSVRPSVAFAASLTLPGGGQWLLGQQRGYLYLGVEALAWTAFVVGRHRGGVLRDRYRDLAWDAARNPGTVRVDPDWAYFEAMSHYHSSGAWDVDASLPGLQPETDSATFNGSVWALARELYLPGGSAADLSSPAYARALEYYRTHGYAPEFGWNWNRNPAAERRYRDLIVRSDDAFRRATIVLGVIVTNHVLSAVDGFLSARLTSNRRGDGSGLRFHATPATPTDPRWRLGIQLEGAR